MDDVLFYPCNGPVVGQRGLTVENGVLSSTFGGLNNGTGHVTVSVPRLLCVRFWLDDRVADDVSVGEFLLGLECGHDLVERGSVIKSVIRVQVVELRLHIQPAIT